MKKNNNVSKSSGQASKARKADRITIGMDLGDKKSRVCILNDGGEVIREASVATTKKGMAQMFGAMAHCRIALEVGTHSPWVSRLLKSFGHEAIVANARQVKLISQSSRKDDKLDAQMLARLAETGPVVISTEPSRSSMENEMPWSASQRSADSETIPSLPMTTTRRIP